MKIVFLGQVGLSTRVSALSNRLTEAGHEVVSMRHMRQADVVHVQGWDVAKLAGIVMWAGGETRLVWTIEAVPGWPRWLVRMLVRAAARVFDAITVTRRDVQYQLLEAAGVRAVYIPDGYDPINTETLSPRRLGMWPGRYCVATAGTRAEEEAVREAYEAAGSKRALVIVNEDNSSERLRVALFKSAAAIILGSSRDQAETILHAMASGKPIVAAAWPFYEEILGTTAQYAKAGDGEELARVMQDVLKGGKRPAFFKASARKRAENHFSWERILADYLLLYRPAVKLVPLDSAGYTTAWQV